MEVIIAGKLWGRGFQLGLVWALIVAEDGKRERERKWDSGTR